MSIANTVLVLINTIILVSGQLMWKFGMQRQDDAFGSMRGVAQLLLSPYVLGGLALYGAATVLWFYILSRVPLSVAYPLQSVAYILAIFGAYFLFHEPLSAGKLGGCMLILAGVTLIGWR
ncbi:MAG: EamA family transporter [Paenibacillaceae bacterium]|nr:EamA family transporter [Paenibacillaceae bacterium]